MACSRVNFTFYPFCYNQFVSHFHLSVIFKLLLPHFTHVLFITMDWLVPFHLYRKVMKTGKQKRLQDLFNNFTDSSS